MTVKNMTEWPMIGGAFRLFFRLPEKIRFILVGGYNTVFAIITYFLLYSFLAPGIHYLVLLLISHVLSVTNSYLSLKWFVFCTCGNYLTEFLRCNLVYLVSLAVNALLLFVCVAFFALNAAIAQAGIVILIAVGTYFAHKFFSYRVTQTGT